MFLRLTFLMSLFVYSAVVHAQDPLTNPDKPTASRSQEPERNSTPDPKSREADRESREIFFRTLNETRSRGAQELCYLLFQESVRKEISLSDDSAKATREILSQTRSSAEKLYEQLKAKEITAEELKVELREIMTSADRDIWKTMSESNANVDRLIGLFVQHRQSAAVLNRVIADKVGLDEPRRHEIIAKKEAVEKEMFEERSRDAQSPGDRFRAWERVQKKIDGEVSKMLTSDQRDKLEKLKGKPFNFEEFAYPPGPPPRGRDGGRDRNRRENGRDEKCPDCEKLANDR